MKDLKQMPYKVEEGAVERAKYRAKMAVREAAHPVERRWFGVQWRWATAVAAVAIVVVGVIGFVKYYDEIIKPLSPMDELIAEMRDNKRVCKYIDLPMQHIADGVLKKMNRHGGSALIREVVAKLRKEIPDATKIIIAQRISSVIDADKIIVMDDMNYENVSRLAPERKYLNKVYRFVEFSRNHPQWSYVPDPYYEGREGFYLVIEMLEEACEKLLDEMA